MPRSSFVFADKPPTLPFHCLLLCVIRGKYQNFTLSLNWLSFVAGYWRIREHPNPLFFFLFLFKCNVLTTIDLDSSKKNSVQCFKLIQVILNGPTLPVGHGSGKTLEGIFLLIWRSDQFGLEGEPIQFWRLKVIAIFCFCIRIPQVHCGDFAIQWLDTGSGIEKMWSSSLMRCVTMQGLCGKPQLPQFY